MGEPQELIAGRYRMVRRIAAGGMGVVWEARDEVLERPVAIKQLRATPGLPEDEVEVAKTRAMREARITARLHHPNAVAVFDAVEQDGEPCLVMQYVPSSTLSALLKEHGAMGPGEVARVGAQIAAALAAAHDLGIVHRDVKPGNILIADADGTALLSDFGISHALGDASLTATSVVHGTPAYLAPEVARGDDSSFASDVFSLGSTLYAASEGAAPFGDGGNAIAVLHRVALGGFAAPQHSGPLGPLLLQMMADDPDERPAMADVARQLEALQEEETGEALAPLPLTTAAEEETQASMPVPTTALPVADTTETRVLAADAEPAADALEAGQPPTAPPEARPTEEPARRRRRPALLLVPVLAVLVVAGGIAAALQLTPDAAPRPTSTGAPASSAQPASRTSSPPASPSRSGTPTPSSTPTPTPTPTRTPTSTPTSTPSATASSPAPTATTSQQLAAAISQYYGLLPGDTGDAWNRLTPAYQQGEAQGRAYYDRFWAGKRSVSATGVTGSAPDRASATITYVFPDGHRDVERRTFRLERQDGVLKIASSTVE